MKNVLLIDSGSGGINVLKECVKVVPKCNFLMFCDNSNLPYGNKTLQELRMITSQNLRNIRTFFPFDVVILACNTLTCTCLKDLRKEFPDVVFIGTEPAIKPALERFEAKDVAVLATKPTLENNALIRENWQLSKISIPWLAGEIDDHLDELEVLRPRLTESVESFLKDGGGNKLPKAVVLGCTHYLAVKDILQEIFGKGVVFFDSANGVARRLAHFVDKDKPNQFQVQIMTSAKEEMLGKFWWWFNKS